MIGPVHAGDFHQLLIVERVTQLHHAAEEFFAPHGQRDFAIRFDSIKQIDAKRLARCIDDAVIRGIAGGRMAHRSIVPTRRIFRCNCMMP